ncbi:MAG: YybS family protein, partial [Desulfobacterales bacterium]
MLKDIANGVLITSLIFAVSILIPIFGFFCSLFIPLPTLYYRLKLGRTTSVIIPALGFIIMVVVISSFTLDVMFFAELLLLGFILGELLESRTSIHKTVLYSCGVVLISGIISLFVYSIASGKDLISILSQYVAQNIELSLMLYQSLGMPEENLRLIQDSLDKIQYILIGIIPGLTITSTLLVIWLNILLSRAVLKSRVQFHPDYEKLNQWQAPDYLVWAVIGCGLFMLFPASAAKLISLNALLILMAIYFFQGIAIVSFFFEKKQVPRLFRIIVYTLIALQQFVLIVVIGIGLFDVWFNFRK